MVLAELASQAMNTILSGSRLVVRLTDTVDC